MTHLTVLTNPTAGHGAAQAAEAAIAHLRARGLTVTHHAATSAAESHALAQEAARTGARGIAAAGGDGLVSIALQAVAATPVALGVIPIGTGNDCARMLDIPLSDPVAAAEVIAAGRIRVIDAGRIQYHGDTTWFATVVASGFDSLVNDRANRMRWPRGRRRYDIAMALEAAKLRPLPFRIELDDQVIDTDVTLVAVGNGTSYGGGMRICPGAILDDGLLDITVVAAGGRLRLLRLSPTVYKGTHVDLPEVSTFRSRRVRLSAADITAYADGDPVAPLPVDIDVVPGALSVFA
ncbi:diacylglycerol kinase [Mycobacteroides abscessus]|uniref:diacylglycerol kinase n=1 Tax=Mycobacteroides abscessus TaxID=36809 RepID=UPI00266DC896|nr:diacylglycerol kinase [Mycobacteroides abscessus]MDO3231544.1 diacylglycerol kinase [Mycobacteroides abscessus subsp. abscessus]MDO3329759.1 diacylglycerol kinase [Mycobacteroides abscessus subsp. abscessus]MDO3346814.1 diacylglycerol kinase [Mycobacteroides abscessus subsp. abscessus]